MFTDICAGDGPGELCSFVASRLIEPGVRGSGHRNRVSWPDGAPGRYLRERRPAVPHHRARGAAPCSHVTAMLDAYPKDLGNIDGSSEIRVGEASGSQDHP